MVAGAITTGKRNSDFSSSVRHLLFLLTSALGAILISVAEGLPSPASVVWTGALSFLVAVGSLLPPNEVSFEVVWGLKVSVFGGPDNCSVLPPPRKSSLLNPQVAHEIRPRAPPGLRD